MPEPAFISLARLAAGAPLARDAAYPGRFDGPSRPLFCLAPDWVFRAAAVAGARGGLLPHLFILTPRLPARRSVFCDTVRRRGLNRDAPAFEGNPALWCPDFPLRAPIRPWPRPWAVVQRTERMLGCETGRRYAPSDGPQGQWSPAFPTGSFARFCSTLPRQLNRRERRDLKIQAPQSRPNFQSTCRVNGPNTRKNATSGHL